jgi:hypothetical protein
VFGVADNYAAIAAAGAATGALDIDNPVGDAVAGAAGIHVARTANAASQGLSLRILVATSDDSIYLLSLPAVGEHPERLLAQLPRTSTEVSVTKMGLSRRLTLTDASRPQPIRLSGSVAPYSRFAAGAKQVIADLAT